jgi:iron complex outermembrane recepter protein
MSGVNRITVASLVGAAALTWSQTSAADTPNTAGSDANVLEVIIVTAQKRSEDIQDVPVSMTSVSQEQLDQLHATQLTDFAGYVPGLQFASTGQPSQGSVSLRGISPLGSSATIATYLDETPLSSSSLYGNASSQVLDLLPFDLSSFEVLRGPQGTLYGASALGGLIKYVTKPPDLLSFSGRIGGDVFSEDGADKAGGGGHASVNVPLLPGTLGLTASFARENTPGVIDNAVTGEKDQNAYSQQVGRVAVLWKPSDDLSLTVTGIQQKIEADNNLNVALDPTSLRPIYGNLKNDNIVPETLDQDLDYFSATLNYNLGWGDLVSASSYSRTRTDTVTDATQIYGVLVPEFGGPTAKSGFDSDVELRKITEEVRLASKPSDTVEWLLGGFYSHENSQHNQVVTAQTLDGASIPGLDPLATVGLPSIFREYAVFGDVTYKFNSSFDLSGGLRWAHNSQVFDQISGGALSVTADQPGSSSQSVVTYSVGPRWHITSDTMAYARVASGYQAGGPNLAIPGVPPAVGADKLTNYELGVKSLLLDRRLQIDLAAFYIDWKNIQVGATNGVVDYLVNGGTASSKGFEFSTLYTPLEGLRLGLNAAYTDAKLTQDVPSIGGLSGDALPYVPKWSGSGTADYAFLQRGAWTARVGGGVRFTGAEVTEVEHSPQAEPLKSYGLLDLNAEVSDDRWTVRLFSKNVTNRVAYTNLIQLTNAGTGAVTQVNGVPLQPREVGLGVDVKF